MSRLAIRNVGKTFPGVSRQAPPTEALRPVSLDVADNDFITVLGPSGCGKSTLLRLVAGLEEPSTGEILLDDVPIRGPGADRGVVFQSYTLFPWLSVRRNICFGLREKGVALAEQREISDRFIARMGLQGFEDHYPKQLSGGMQQRVAIARALACRPAVLLMDEPFSAVDALTRVGLQELLRALWRELGLTVVFVTHDVDEGVYLSTRVVALTRAPGAVAADLPIELPHPRNQITTRELPQYLDYRGRLLAQLFADEGLVAMEPA